MKGLSPVGMHIASQLVAALCLWTVTLLTVGDPSHVLFGWAVFVSNAAMVAFIAQSLLMRSNAKANPGSAVLSGFFLLLKPLWIAGAGYIGLVVLGVRGELLVLGASIGLATFAFTSYMLGGRRTISEKS